MFAINDTLQIPDEELVFSYARSGGPGGQNVNKVASKAILHWSLSQNTSIADDVKDRLRTLFPSRATVEGEFVIQSQEYRDQERNRLACLEKLREFLVKRSLNVSISVDGNVNPQTIHDMVQAGADTVVLGSSGLFMKDVSIPDALHRVYDAIDLGLARRGD